MKTAGQVCFEQYWKQVFISPVPFFDRLGPREKQAWEIAARKAHSFQRDGHEEGEHSDQYDELDIKGTPV